MTSMRRRKTIQKQGRQNKNTEWQHDCEGTGGRNGRKIDRIQNSTWNEVIMM